MRNNGRTWYCVSVISMSLSHGYILTRGSYSFKGTKQDCIGDGSSQNHKRLWESDQPHYGRYSEASLGWCRFSRFSILLALSRLYRRTFWITVRWQVLTILLLSDRLIICQRLLPRVVQLLDWYCMQYISFSSPVDRSRVHSSPPAVG